MGYRAKAIDTVYGGYRFRSRLEARWAVFFDAVGLPFVYEKEGFLLDGGIKYLPDFWLPSLRLWVEIKPHLEDAGCSEADFRNLDAETVREVCCCDLFNLMRLFRDSQEWPVACIVGLPGIHRIWFFGWDLSDGGGGAYEDEDAQWCVANGQVTLDVHIKSPDREIYADSLYGPCLEHFTLARDYKFILRPIKEALKFARHARFEHGEKPEVS